MLERRRDDGPPDETENSSFGGIGQLWGGVADRI